MTAQLPTGAETIGFVGLGHMGEPMAARLVEAGHCLTVYNRSDGAAQRLMELGASRAKTFGDLEDCRTIFLMLPDLPQISAAVTGPDGLLARWADTPPAAGTLLVVMSSVSPSGVQEFGLEIHEATHGAVTVVDAPVSGGTAGAADGTLAIMVGAEPEMFERLEPLLSVLGTTVRRMGALGAGSLTKACNQLVVGITTAALAEAAVLAERSGIDVESMFEVLGGGLADSRVLQSMAPRFIARNYAVSGPAKFMAKDLGFVEAAARSTGTAVPMATAGVGLYQQVIERGLGEQDLSVVHRVISELAMPPGENDK